MSSERKKNEETEIVLSVDLHAPGCDCDKSGDEDALIIELLEGSAGPLVQAGYSRAYARNFDSIFGRSNN